MRISFMESDILIVLRLANPVSYSIFAVYVNNSCESKQNNKLINQFVFANSIFSSAYHLHPFSDV